MQWTKSKPLIHTEDYEDKDCRDIAQTHKSDKFIHSSLITHIVFGMKTYYIINQNSQMYAKFYQKVQMAANQVAQEYWIKDSVLWITFAWGHSQFTLCWFSSP